MVREESYKATACARYLLEQGFEKLTTPLSQYHAMLMPGTGDVDIWQPHDGLLRKAIEAQYFVGGGLELTEETLRLLESGAHPEALAWATALLTLHRSVDSERLLLASKASGNATPFLILAKMALDTKNIPQVSHFAGIAAEMGSTLGLALTAQANLFEKDYGEALRCAEAAWNAESRASANTAGHCQFMLHDYAEAETWFLRAIEYDDSDAEAHRYLAFLLANRNEFTTAKVHAKRGAALGDEKCMAAAGIAECESKRYQEAISFLEKVPELNSNAQALFFLGFALGRSGRTSEGIPHIRKAATLGYQSAITFITKYDESRQTAQSEDE